MILIMFYPGEGLTTEKVQEFFAENTEYLFLLSVFLLLIYQPLITLLIPSSSFKTLKLIYS